LYYLYLQPGFLKAFCSAKVRKFCILSKKNQLEKLFLHLLFYFKISTGRVYRVGRAEKLVFDFAEKEKNIIFADILKYQFL